MLVLGGRRLQRQPGQRQLPQHFRRNAPSLTKHGVERPGLLVGVVDLLMGIPFTEARPACWYHAGTSTLQVPQGTGLPYLMPRTTRI